MSEAAIPVAMNASIPARIAREGSSGVEGTLAIDISPVSSLRWTKSEKVPPVSTVTR
jgi:hypothetical protein